MHRNTLKILIVVLFGLAVLVSCSNSDTGSGNADLVVMLTDKPSDYIASALVTFSRVYLKGGPNDVDLLAEDEETVTYDLLLLRDGLEARLADGLIPADEYSQLRMVVDSAEVTLVDPATFTDGSITATLFVPSGMESGIKVLLAEPIVAEDGSLTVVVVDFDVDSNFLIHGDPNVPNGVTSVQFTPLLNEKSRTSTD
jgi:hypothetical protein